jgi:RNA polymerase sigma-70 factor (ECF subfamily)
MTFEQLYRAYMPSVRRFTLYLTGDTVETDDIVAETFLRAWTADAPLKARSIEAYLLTVARNLYRRRVRTRHADWPPPDADTIADPQPGADRGLAARDELDRTMERLQRLSEIDRAALLMRAFHGLDYAEIGNALGIAPGTAKVKVHRARAWLTTQRDMP